ncbi:hypothetical protein WJX77_003314 [Trebouxia sp. C0004]
MQNLADCVITIPVSNTRATL